MSVEKTNTWCGCTCSDTLTLTYIDYKRVWAFSAVLFKKWYA